MTLIHAIGFSEPGSTSMVHAMVAKTGYSIRWYSDLHELRTALEATEHGLVFLKPDKSMDAYELCMSLSSEFSRLSFILLVSQAQLDFKHAMHAGATDIVGLPCSMHDLLQAVREAERRIEWKAEHRSIGGMSPKRTRVITMASTKGGVGKTTLSVNAATALAGAGNKVAVVDLDLQFGDVAISVDKEPDATLYEWIKEHYEQGNTDVVPFMTSTDVGFDFLAAPNRPEFADVVTGEHVGIIIGELRKNYDVIVIDTPPALLETGLVALENSDDILMITAMDLPTIKNAKLAIETLEVLHMKDKIKVAVNRDTEMEGIKVSSVEEILGLEIFARIPSDYKNVVSSINRGVPFVYSHPRLAISKGVQAMVEKLMGSGGQGKRETRRGLLSLLSR